MQEESNVVEIISKLKIPILILVVAIVAMVYIIWMRVWPNFQRIDSLKKSYVEVTQKIEENQAEIKRLEEQLKVAEDTGGVEKEVFTPAEGGAEAKDVIASEFSEILDLIRANSIKTKSIDYNYDPDDAFKSGAGDKFNVALLSMSMISTYTNFENFMKDLYKHEHFLDIVKVDVSPYEKDKSILIINLDLKLYSKK